jgi:hypothetical protein
MENRHGQDRLLAAAQVPDGKFRAQVFGWRPMDVIVLPRIEVQRVVLFPASPDDLASSAIAKPASKYSWTKRATLASLRIGPASMAVAET